jgi:import inner membrane translocase subunit TIM44
LAESADPSQSGDDKSKSDSQSQSQKKSRPPPEEDHGPPQSPFKVFAQVLKEEISKNKAWQENVKQLQGDVDKLADSAAMKRARDVYERARVSNDLPPRLDHRPRPVLLTCLL